MKYKFAIGQRVRLTSEGIFAHGKLFSHEKELEDLVGIIEKPYDHGEFVGIFVPAYWIGGELGRELAKNRVFEGGKDVSRRVEETDIIDCQ